MSPPLTLREHDPQATAARLFLAHDIHHAPVVGDDGRVVGLLSARDLLRGLDGVSVRIHGF